MNMDIMSGSSNDSNNQKEILSIIDNENKIDLFSIEANKYLIKIKTSLEQAIGRQLDPEKTDKIDEEIKKSIRDMLIVQNNVIDYKYLNELVYIYYAIYNNTLDEYYKIKNKYSDIYLFMLDERFYNNIMHCEKAEWEKFSHDSWRTLDDAYCYNLEEEMLTVLEINNNFILPHNFNFSIKPTTGIETAITYRYEFIKNGYFKQLFDIVGPERIANGDIEILVKALDIKYTDYVKELIAINPSIKFDYKQIFIWRDMLINYFAMEQIAFFSEKNLKTINRIIQSRTKKNRDIEEIIKYYSEIVNLKPEEPVFLNDYEISMINKIITDEIDFPASVYAQLTNEELNELVELFCKYLSKRISLLSIRKFLNKIGELREKYTEPKQKKLIK